MNKIVFDRNRFFAINAGVNKMSAYIDCDGVIIDTNRYSRQLLLEQTGIDKWTHKRENIEADKIVAEFYKNLNWGKFLKEVPILNDSIHALESLQASGMYFGPCVFTGVNTEEEAEEKRKFFKKVLPTLSVICTPNSSKGKKLAFTDPYARLCRYQSAFLIDDEPHNLRRWPAYAIPFNGGNPNYNFPSMESLEEMFDMIYRVNSRGEKYYPVVDTGDFSRDTIECEFDIDPDTGFVVTDTMKKNFVLRKKL